MLCQETGGDRDGQQGYLGRKVTPPLEHLTKLCISHFNEHWEESSLR